MNTRRKTSRRLIHATGEQEDDKDGDRANIENTGGDKETPEDENAADVEAFNIEEYLGDIREIDKDVEKSEINSAAMVSSDVTKAHSRRAQLVEDEFVDILSQIGKFEKCKYFTELKIRPTN